MIEHCESGAMADHYTRLAELTRLAQLRRERAAISAEINLIEAGLSKAAYDGAMALQLAAVNDARVAEGKPKLSMTEFLMGREEEGAN